MSVSVAPLGRANAPVSANLSNRLNLVIMGTGQVGRELMRQIEAQQQALANSGQNFRVIAAANSRQFWRSDVGIRLDDLNSSKAIALHRPDWNHLYQWCQQHGCLPVAVVDCTASRQLSEAYAHILDSGFHLVTANKIANAASLQDYQKVRAAARRSRREFRYEANVGAGLPVLEPIQRLRDSGDSLLSFEGILSGSLSYIFGEVERGLSFSAATERALQLGYTEPHPALDLMGVDVARKLLIIAREFGLPLELAQIRVENLLPPELKVADSVPAFIQQLKSLDPTILARQKAAQSERKVLRYVAKIESGKARVALQAVDFEHPLAAIKSGQNALSFLTHYYRPYPLLISGYGAGAEVTAAGVFADLLRLPREKPG